MSIAIDVTDEMPVHARFEGEDAIRDRIKEVENFKKLVESRFGDGEGRQEFYETFDFLLDKILASMKIVSVALVGDVAFIYSYLFCKFLPHSGNRCIQDYRTVKEANRETLHFYHPLLFYHRSYQSYQNLFSHQPQ